MRVNKRTESSEFILIMYWLQEDVGISIGIQVIKSIDMDAEKSFSRMTFRDKVSFCILCRAAEKRNGRAVSSNSTELFIGVSRRHVRHRTIEFNEKFFHSLRLQFCLLLVEGRSRRRVSIQAKEIQNLTAGAG